MRIPNELAHGPNSIGSTEDVQKEAWADFEAAFKAFRWCDDKTFKGGSVPGDEVAFWGFAFDESFSGFGLPLFEALILDDMGRGLDHDPAS